MTFPTSTCRSALVSLLVLVLSLPIASAQGYGIAAGEPMLPFLNGSMPPALGVPPGQTIQAVDAFPNLRFDHPVWLGPEPGTNRLFVVERKGVIWAFENDPNTTTKTLVLDVEARTEKIFDGGFSVIAFHPEYGQTGSPNKDYIYAFYSAKTAFYGSGPNPGRARTHDGTVSRFTREPDGTFDPASEFIYIKQQCGGTVHHGGGMEFGNDGFLYITVGDDFDAGGSTQKLDNRLTSGVLRIDIDNDPAKSHPIRRQPNFGYTQNYSIPTGNPWLDPAGTLLEEFYAIGFRSPWRMSYDNVTDQFFLGDVGANSREELNIVEKGKNYQWPFKEGDLTLAGTPNPLIGVEQEPYWTYPRNVGRCIIAGQVYRGSAIPDLQGKLIAADNNFWTIWSIDFSDPNTPVIEEIGEVPNQVQREGLSSFGVDHSGEMYFLMIGPDGANQGVAYKMTVPDEGSTNVPPAKLLDTGVFTDLNTLTPATGVFPYSVANPLWSDNAVKDRYFAVPNGGDGSHDNAAERITFSPDGNWQFPEGSVFVKHFELPDNETDPTSTVRLETRLIVVRADGNVYGVTYRWNDQGTDATIVPDERQTRDITITHADSSTSVQTWTFPSRNDCLQCHTTASPVLGPRTFQFNCDSFYPRTGVADNQLRTLNNISLFEPALAENTIPDLPQGAAVDDESASLQRRARSYLHSNCASCHQPGVVQAVWDGRYTYDMAATAIINGPVFDNRGIAGAKVVTPAEPDRSLAYVRNACACSFRMPPIATDLVDVAGTDLLRRWIESLDPNVVPPAPITEQSSITYSDFNSTAGIQLNGDASATDGVLLVTPNADTQSGSAFLTQAIDLSATESFSSQFSFRMAGTGDGADGMTFTIQAAPAAASVLGSAGGGLGYEGISPSLAVALDTYGGADHSANSVRILSNGNVFNSQSVIDAPFDLESGNVHHAWVDYDAGSKLLRVFLSETIASKPAAPVLQYTVDLASAVGSKAHIGFTGGTGGITNSHEVLNWTLTSTGDSLSHSYAIPVLTGPTGPVGGNFNLTVDFDREVAGLAPSDFHVSNGSVLAVLGSGTRYTAVIEPDLAGPVDVSLPSDKVVDSGLNTNESSAAFNVTFNPDPGSNSPPIAMDDPLLTVNAGDISAPLDLLSNDSDPDGDLIGIISVTLPNHGNLYFTNNSQLLYRPNPGHSGSDSFTYTISDFRGGEATATATLQVIAAANALLLEAESASLTGGFASFSAAGASGGQAISVPEAGATLGAPDPAHAATFTFRVIEPGDYRLRGAVRSPNGELSNSFWVEIDGQPAGGYLWDTDATATTDFAIDYVSDRDGADPVDFTLTTGLHTVTVYQREDSTELDHLELVSPARFDYSDFDPPYEMVVNGDARFPGSETVAFLASPSAATASTEFSQAYAVGNLYDGAVTAADLGSGANLGDEYAGTGDAPHVVVYDMGAGVDFSGIAYSQRAGGNPADDKVTQIEFWVTDSDPGVASTTLPILDTPVDALLTGLVINDNNLNPYALGTSLNGRYIVMRLTGSGGNPGGKELILTSSTIFSPPVIRLTGLLANQTGSAFRVLPVPLGSIAGFNTDFSFRVSSGGTGGEGLAFVLHSDLTGQNALGTGGTGLGVEGMNPALAVRLEPGTSNSLIVRLEGSASPALGSAPIPFPLDDGSAHHLWIDYDGDTGTLAVFLAQTSATKPGVPLLSIPGVSLAAVLGTETYPGFTAASGVGSTTTHDIETWSFASKLDEFSAYRAHLLELCVDPLNALYDPWADADLDGLANYLEYALGLPLLTANYDPVLKFELAPPDAISLYYDLAGQARADVSHTVDFSTDLINWIPLADVAPVLPLLSLDGNANRVTWSGLEALPSAVLNGRAFFRLRAAPTE